MIDHLQVEICCGSYIDANQACQFTEVDRIELNSALELGGLTPSLQTFKQVRQMTDKKIICMVRPRGAGFCYNEDEKRIMFLDAQTFLEEDADGIVFGFLHSDNTIDQEATAQMVSLIHGYGKEAVFHKAFDLTPNPMEACQILRDLGVQRILTSGQAPTTDLGIDCIRNLQDAYGDVIEILPGGGINETNVVDIIRKTGCPQFHMTAKSTYDDNGSYVQVDARNIRKVFNQIQYALQENKHTFTREDLEMLHEND